VATVTETAPLHLGAIRGILRDVAFLEECWPELAESRFPGTSRPWREPQLTPERRAELAEQARRDAQVSHTDLPKHLRTKAPEELGESPAPGHVDVMDLLVEILAVADETAEHVGQVAGVDRLPPASSAFADPRPFLRFIAQNVTGAAETDEGMVGVVQDNLRPLVGEVRRSLSLLMDGQILKAECPWCRGVTPTHPGGGGHTLRVRMIRDPRDDADPEDRVAAVVCQGPACEPPEAECGTWDRGRPAWPAWEWEWLAVRLEAVA
jgi:hypothetical protein